MSIRRIFAGLFPALFTFICAAQPVNPDAKNAVLYDQYIRQAMPVWRTPGLSVVVVKNGNVVFSKGYGVRDALTKEAFTPTTLSACASTSKAMTAVCMGILVDEGKVKWSDKVSDILPEFKLSDPYSTAEITVLDLFTHNTGLGNADYLWVFGYNRSEVLRRMQYIPPAYSLRASYTYQNLMYMVAGEVIRKVSGTTWDEFIQKRIFAPLAMQHTYSDHSAIPSTEIKTTGHFRHPDTDSVMTIPYPYNDNIGAAGGVWSCAEDMGKWITCMLDSSKYGTKRLITPDTWSFLFRPKIVVPGLMYPTMKMIKPHWQTYGMGWFQHDYKGSMVNFHTGSLDGLTTIIGLLLDQHTGVYIFGNLDHAELRHALMYKALDLWGSNDNSNDWSNRFYPLYKEQEDTVKKRLNELLARRVTGTKPSLALTAYKGKYSNRLLGDVQVELKGDALQIDFPENIKLELAHWHFDTFRGTFNNWWNDRSWVQFILDKEGNVSGISIDGDVFSK